MKKVILPNTRLKPGGGDDRAGAGKPAEFLTGDMLLEESGTNVVDGRRTGDLDAVDRRRNVLATNECLDCCGCSCSSGNATASGESRRGSYNKFGSPTSGCAAVLVRTTVDASDTPDVEESVRE